MRSETDGDNESKGHCYSLIMRWLAMESDEYRQLGVAGCI